MSVWDSVSSTYLDAASTAVPLHRLIVFLGGFTGSIALSKQTHLSVFESVSRLKLVDIGSLETGILSDARMSNAIIGFGLVIGGWAVSRLLVWAVFVVASRLTNLQERAQIAISKSTFKSTDPIGDRQAMVALLDSALKHPAARIRAMNTSAELLIGFGVGFLVAALWGNVLDGMLGLTLLLIAVAVDVLAVRLFLSDFFGPALMRARLQGKRLPTSFDLEC